MYDSKPRRKYIFPQIVLLTLVIITMIVAARFALLYFYRSAYPIHYRESVEQYSDDTGVPPALIYAVIRTESGFDPFAASSVDARGLMQITEETFEWLQFRRKEPQPLAFEALYDTDLNIQYGTALLAFHMEEFGSIEVALCAYHAGRGNVNKWLANPSISQDGSSLDYIPFRDTAYYVNRVMQTQEMYQRLYEFE